jgi:hypothetical protein
MTAIAQQFDPLHTVAEDFLTSHHLHPDPADFLKQGFTALFRKAWRGATDGHLYLAAQWALWTWRVDDVIDTDLRTAKPGLADELVMRLADVLHGASPDAADHPTVRALGDLVGRTAPAMPEGWWDRYRHELNTWLQAAADKLHSHVIPRRVPSLRRYLELRPADGGMLLAAMWTELALDCVSPDWDSSVVQALLRHFSAVGTLGNDLAAPATDPFTAQAALAQAEGLTAAEARTEVEQLLDAERRLFALFRSAIREPMGWRDPADRIAPATVHLADGLDRFLEALKGWTSSSSRYAFVQAPVIPKARR